MKIFRKWGVLGAILILPITSFAQQVSKGDSVIQLSGKIMITDSLTVLPGVTVTIQGENRGTVTDERGLFNIEARKGQIIQFTYVGYRLAAVKIPTKTEGNQYNINIVMMKDTLNLPVAIIRITPSKEEFDMDFLHMNLNDRQKAIAEENLDPETIRALAAGLPNDAREATGYYLVSRAQRDYVNGQIPRQSIFDAVRWNNFIKSLHQGYFKEQVDSSK